MSVRSNASPREPMTHVTAPAFATDGIADAFDYDSARKRARDRRRLLVIFLRVALAVIIVSVWEAGTRIGCYGNDTATCVIDKVFFGQPSGIWDQLVRWVQNGTAQGPLWEQITVTREETILGLAIGVVVDHREPAHELWLCPGRRDRRRVPGSAQRRRPDDRDGPGDLQRERRVRGDAHPRDPRDRRGDRCHATREPAHPLASQRDHGRDHLNTRREKGDRHAESHLGTRDHRGDRRRGLRRDGRHAERGTELRGKQRGRHGVAGAGREALDHVLRYERTDLSAEKANRGPG